MTTAEIIAGLLAREGSEYTQDPLDRGGPTKYGITQAALSEWRGQPATPEQVRALTIEDAKEIYEHQYITKSGFLHVLDERLRIMLVDWAVNCGISTATKAVQRLVGVEVDGVCGPVTIGAINSRSPRDLLKALGLARQAYYVRIVELAPEQVRFLRGWLARNWAVTVEAL